MKFMFTLLLTLTMTSVFAAPVREKILLGETHLARHYTDLDVIQLSPVKCSLSKIQLKVKKRPAEIDHVAIQYGNGNWDYIVVRERFARGSVSRWIQLKTQYNRCIQKIAVIGESEGRRFRRANIEVYAR